MPLGGYGNHRHSVHLFVSPLWAPSGLPPPPETPHRLTKLETDFQEFESQLAGRSQRPIEKNCQLVHHNIFKFSGVWVEQLFSDSQPAPHRGLFCAKKNP